MWNGQQHKLGVLELSEGSVTEMETGVTGHVPWQQGSAGAGG